MSSGLDLKNGFVFFSQAYLLTASGASRPTLFSQSSLVTPCGASIESPSPNENCPIPQAATPPTANPANAFVTNLFRLAACSLATMLACSFLLFAKLVSKDSTANASDKFFSCPFILAVDFLNNQS